MDAAAATLGNAPRRVLLTIGQKDLAPFAAAPQHRYVLRRTLRDLLNQLGEHRFVRIHKSAAVNMAEIETLSPLPLPLPQSCALHSSVQLSHVDFTQVPEPSPPQVPS